MQYQEQEASPNKFQAERSSRDWDGCSTQPEEDAYLCLSARLSIDLNRTGKVSYVVGLLKCG